VSTLILVRHAETALNAERRYQGRTDGPLTEGGVSEARAIGALLRAQFGAEAVLHASDAPRARRTAELALPGLPVIVDARLAELDFGAFDGATFDENLAAHGDAFRDWILDPRTVAPPGGESLEALEARVGEWLESLDPAGSAIAVSHGGPIRAALARILGIPFETLQRFEIKPGDALRVELAADDAKALAWPVLLRANIASDSPPTDGAPGGFESETTVTAEGTVGSSSAAVLPRRMAEGGAHAAPSPASIPPRASLDPETWLEQICFEIPRADRAHGRTVQARLDNLTKPVGSLGRLEHLALRLARISGDPTPALRRRTIFVLAGDHGVVAQGVSAYPREVTAQMCRNYASGGAAISAIARAVGAEVVAVDVGVAADGDSLGIPSFKIRRGTDDLSLGPAMSREDALRAIRLGASLVQERVGTSDVFALGEMGIGNSTAAAAITAALCGVRAERVVGAGTGLDDEGIQRKTEIVGRALARIAGTSDPVDVLAEVGGLEIAALVGVVLASARARKPVVMDGFITGAAALVAVRLAPQVIDYVIASHRSREKGHAFQLARLGLEPLLDLDMRLGEGTGAALALPLLEAAAGVLREMATFASAGVSTKEAAVESVPASETR
jgi:nicotinate-nucleotide--dimethylbenzimidazole phosphoribosyltransferase